MKKYFSKMYYPLCICFIVTFILGIFLVNFYGENWYNMDVYGDAMYAKYSADAQSFFPENWIFGNQFYIVATPNIAALIYSFCDDAVLSLGIASCVMTLFCIASFIYCIKPFANKKGIIISLLCFIGAGIVGSSAGGTTKGFQVFFTMGSYYACYLIGILFTLGIWLRLYNLKKVNSFSYIVCFMLNFALGIQSPREMLVLNLPLCAISVFLVFFKERPWKNKWLSKENLFALAMFAANLCGIIFIGILKKEIVINQHDILITDDSLFQSIKSIISSFLGYAGFADYRQNLWIFIYKNILAIFNSSLILYVVITTTVKYFKTKKLNTVNILILFCLVSLLAVVCAGLLFIRVRSIYFFVWHILLCVSYLYVAENLKDKKLIYKSVMSALLVFSVLGLGFNFVADYQYYNKTNAVYHQVADTLKNEGITHVLYEDDYLFEEGPRIAACSDGEIITAPFDKNFDNNEGFTPDLMLCGDDWYNAENRQNSYVAILESSLEDFEKHGAFDYFSSNAELKHTYNFNGRNLLLYSVSEELYFDLVN